MDGIGLPSQNESHISPFVQNIVRHDHATTTSSTPNMHKQDCPILSKLPVTSQVNPHLP